MLTAMGVGRSGATAQRHSPGPDRRPGGRWLGGEAGRQGGRGGHGSDFGPVAFRPPVSGTGVLCEGEPGHNANPRGACGRMARWIWGFGETQWGFLLGFFPAVTGEPVGGRRRHGLEQTPTWIKAYSYCLPCDTWRDVPLQVQNQGRRGKIVKKTTTSEQIDSKAPQKNITTKPGVAARTTG